MKTCLFYSIIALLLMWPAKAYTQVNCITDPPLPPVFTSVSVQPETGNTLFTWTLSPSPDIAAYIIYSYKNGDGIALDTIRDPLATSYTLSSTATKYFSVSYVVAAMRLPRCTSIFSNVLNSIFEEVSIDTCVKRLNVSWNSYPSFPLSLTGYSVLMAVNGGSYNEAENVSPGDTALTLSDFTINAQYCFIIRADLEGGKFSSSNKNCISTKMERPPQWINADQATINSSGNVTLSFTIDPLSELTHFSLERKSGPAASFQEISKPVSVNGLVHYTDIQADNKIINFYRLSALNSCNLPVISSNPASNIVLSLERSGDNINLSWNGYRQWLGTVSSYKLFANTGKGYEEKAEIAGTDTVYQLGYKQIMFDVTSDRVCFYIAAIESSNPYGISGESISSEICTNPTEVITVPNVFTPNNDLKNDLFRPVLSFTPLDYHLIITDAHSKVLFDTRDFMAEWDGTLNGYPQPQGVCLWYLKLTTPSGKKISRTGTLTVIRNY